MQSSRDRSLRGLSNEYESSAISAGKMVSAIEDILLLMISFVRCSKQDTRQKIVKSSVASIGLIFIYTLDFTRVAELVSSMLIHMCHMI